MKKQLSKTGSSIERVKELGSTMSKKRNSGHRRDREVNDYSATVTNNLDHLKLDAQNSMHNTALLFSKEPPSPNKGHFGIRKPSAAQKSQIARVDNSDVASMISS